MIRDLLRTAMNCRPAPRRRGLARPRARRGAVALEFALIALPFFTMIMAIMEVCWQLATSAALDHAALKASRFGATGESSLPIWQQGNTPEEELPTNRCDSITWLISSSTGGLIRRGPNLSVQTRTWGALGGTGEGSEGAGAGGQIVQYTITYQQSFITRGIAASLWGGETFPHQSVIVVKNEPFDTTPACPDT